MPIANIPTDGDSYRLYSEDGKILVIAERKGGKLVLSGPHSGGECNIREALGVPLFLIAHEWMLMMVHPEIGREDGPRMLCVKILSACGLPTEYVPSEVA